MQILEKAVMRDGTHIQLEDWSEHNTIEYPTLHGLTIGAYPKAKNTGRYGWVQRGKEFRLSICMSTYSGYTNEQVKADYEALKLGNKKLEDLAQHFWNWEKDMWYLGMDVEDRNY